MSEGLTRMEGWSLSGRSGSRGKGPMYQNVSGTWGNLVGLGGGRLGIRRGGATFSLSTEAVGVLTISTAS
jgi:hypothetical protein